MPESVFIDHPHGIIVKYFKNLGQFQETNWAYPISQEFMKNSWACSGDSAELILHISFHVTHLKKQAANNTIW